MRKLVLFDIDGTLVLTARAGYRALNRACEQIVGGSDPLSGLAVAGRTDRGILTEVLARLGRRLDDELLGLVREQYLVNLRDEIHRPGEGVKGVMPGVRELLDALHGRDDIFIGLLTGNFEAGARIKLEYFDLWRYFRCGAYGDDAADRNALVPFALARARECGLPDVSPEQILVVGDTPNDVACARAAGAVPIGVATGGFTIEHLRASGADIVFEDLSETARFLELL